MVITVEDKDIPEDVEDMRERLRQLQEWFMALGSPVFMSVMVGDYILHVASGTLPELVSMQVNGNRYLEEKVVERSNKCKDEPGICDGDCMGCIRAAKEALGDSGMLH